jgi:hypothetical protein
VRFRYRAALCAAGLSVAALGGCRKAEAPSGLPPEPPAAALARAFRPPENGQLTAADLDLYVKVRRAAKGRPDADAARAVGVDPDRFGWVQARVIEALVALDSRRVQEDAAETYGRALASLRETRRSVRDPENGRTLDVRIAQLERERAALRRAEKLPAGVAANARLVAGRRAEVVAVASP